MPESRRLAKIERKQALMMEKLPLGTFMPSQADDVSVEGINDEVMRESYNLPSAGWKKSNTAEMPREQQYQS